jgi:hypothetical protein
MFKVEVWPSSNTSSLPGELTSLPNIPTQLHNRPGAALLGNVIFRFFMLSTQGPPTERI